MKHTIKTRLVCLVLVVLLAAAALCLTGCAKKETAAPDNAQSQTADADAPQEVGEGDKLFYFNVTFSDGETASYAVHTDAETVGEALVSLDLIDGEDSEYGLYVKTVGDETLDYDANGMYWAFYEGDEYATAGVDATQITDGATYAFVASK